MRAVAVVSVARSDAGIYLPVLQAIQRSSSLDLRLMVTGMHLSPEFGETWRDFDRDGIPIAERVECTVSSDTPTGVSASMGLGVLGFNQVFSRQRPDVLVVLGDRFEMLAAAVAALPYVIPTAHIHGGEVTEGAIDEAIRHSLTKMSHLHFVSTETYARRVIQLGEAPWRVAVSGAPGLDAMQAVEIWSRAHLEEKIGLSFDAPVLMATLHPVTLDYGQTSALLDAFLAAIEAVDLPVVFTYPNADTQGRSIIAALEAFVARRGNARVVAHLGSAGYFSLMRHAAAMVGNSSSGLIEAPSFGLPVVNIGDRQRGRLRAANVIDVPGEAAAIAHALRRATSPAFRESLQGLTNPYGDGHAAERIVRVLETVDLDQRLTMKTFHDLA